MTETPQKAVSIGGEIRVSLNPQTGELSVNAPVNKVIALGLLELARAAILQAQPPRPAVEVPNLAEINNLGRSH